MSSSNDAPGSTPWYVRGKRALLGIGAIAGAITATWGAIVLLVPPNTADVATVDSIELKSRTPLRAFVPSSAGQMDVQPAAKVDVDTPTARQHYYSVSTVDGGTSPPSSSSSSPSTSPTASPELTTSPTPSPSGSEVPSPEPSETITVDNLRQLPDEYFDALTSELANRGMNRETSDMMLRISRPKTTDEHGDPIPPEEVAGRIEDSLALLETEPTDEGTDLLGWTVSVGLRLIGLQDVPLLLTWSVDGVDEPLTWGSSGVAYEIRATTPDDGGTVDVWVPDLVEPGSYNLNVTLVHKPSGAVADSGTPLTLPAE
jgi:hypothetical protein